jgi:mannose-6-phosphate isomerase-like protein (cupin superfamily)
MNDSFVRFLHLDDVDNARSSDGVAYREFLRVPSMSAGVYALAAGAVDMQSPHQQDELYYVVNGRARMQAGTLDQEVGAGSVIFVAASVPHRFYDIREALMIVVFFAPAETG